MGSAFDKYWQQKCEPVHQAHYGVDVFYQSPDPEEDPKRISAIKRRDITEREYNNYGGYDFVTRSHLRIPLRGNEALSADGSFSVPHENPSERGLKTEYSIEAIHPIEGERLQVNLRRVTVGAITAPSHFEGE